MTLERNKSEIIIKLSTKISDLDLQELIDLIKLKEIESKSKATLTDVDVLSKEVNKNMMDNFLQKRNLI